MLIVINISTSLSPRCRRGEMPTLQVYSQGCFFLYPGRSAQRALPRQLEISVQSPSSLSESHWIALNLRTEYENAVLSFAKTQPPTVACRLGVARCLSRSRKLAAPFVSAVPIVWYDTRVRTARWPRGVVHLVSCRRRRAPPPGGGSVDARG